MSTLKIEHISNIANSGPDISIDSSGHLNIVNGSLQMGGTTMLDTSDTTLKNVSKIGIGIATPADKLEIQGSSSDGIRLSVSGQSYYHKIRSNGDGLLLSADDSDAGGAGADIRFRVANDEKMRINHDGNVGIGTTAPDQPLQVKGVIETQATNSTNGFMMYTYTDNTYRINYNGAGGDELILTSGGVLGLGNTPGAWSANYPALTIGQGATLTGHASNTQTQLGQNWWIGTGNQYIVNGAASRLVMNPDSTIIFSQAPSGTANATMSTTNDRLVINPSGYVGIGSGTPEIFVDVVSNTQKAMRLRFIDDNNSSATNPLAMEYKAGLEIENLYSGSAPSANGTKVAKLQFTTVTSSGYGATATIMGLAESGGYDAGAMVFALGNNSSGLDTEKMRLTSANGLKVISDSGNSTSADNISIKYLGTAGAHKSGYLFRDKRDAVNAAIKNNLQDDSATNYAAHMEFQTAHAGTLTTQMTIDRYGQVMTPNQPSFRAWTTPDFTSNGVLEAAQWSEQHDNNNDFSNGRFTCPVDGVYLFTVIWDSLSSLAGLNLLVNTSSYYVKWEPTGVSGASWESRAYSTTVKLSSGDYVRLEGTHASGSNPFHMGAGYWGHFAGHLLG